jgi:hypothetical protein
MWQILLDKENTLILESESEIEVVRIHRQNNGFNVCHTTKTSDSEFNVVAGLTGCINTAIELIANDSPPRIYSPSPKPEMITKSQPYPKTWTNHR